jgi:hypothetical protein
MTPSSWLGRRIHPRILLSLTLCLLATSNGPALAGPPFETDDPEPVGCHSVEIDVAQARQGAPTSSGYLWEVDYGPTKNVETSIGGQPGEIDLASAIQLAPETLKTPQVGFLPALTVKSDGTKETFLPFWAQKTIKDWTIFGGGGVSHGTEFGGLALMRNFRSGSSLGFELYHESQRNPLVPESPRIGLAWIDQFEPSQALMVWGGRSLDPGSRYLFYIGFQAVLAPAHHASNCGAATTSSR